MGMEAKQYRSPTRKLLKFFERSRDRWKQKCLDAKLRVKRLHTKVADLRASRQKWREEAKRLQAEVARLQAELEEQKVLAAAR